MNNQPEQSPVKWRNWYDKLAKDVGLEPRALGLKIKDFRASRQVNDVLRSTYPTERGIDGYSGSHPPRHKTIDLILSFLDSEFPDRSTKFAKLAKQEILQARDKHKLSVTRTFDAEEFRRQAYWKKIGANIDEHIKGFYIMHRCNSDNMYRKELVYICRDRSFKQSLRIFWYRKIHERYHTYVGNLYIGDGFYNGTLVQSSSDKLMRPLSITVLNDDDITTEFVFTGTITGIGHDHPEIFHYPVALERARKYDSFLSRINDDEFAKCANNICESLEAIETNIGLERLLQNRQRLQAGEIVRALRKVVD